MKAWHMFKWFKQFSGTQPDGQLPQDRDGQNDWITAKHIAWQARWHDLFDADSALAGLHEFEREAAMPATLDTDYRLIFGFFSTTPETQKKCFGLFLSGAEMQRRFAAVLAATRAQMPETEARARLSDVIGLMERIARHKDIGSFDVTVVNTDTEDGNNALLDTDDVTVLLERPALEPLDSKGLQEFAAASFLNEPLLAIAENLVQPRNWITGAMIGGLADEVHGRLYDMWVGGWQVRVGEKGLILAQHKA